MTEKERMDKVLSIFRKYCSRPMFKDMDEYNMCVGWKVVRVNGTPHLVATNKWSMVDIILDGRYSTSEYTDMLEDAGLPESTLDEDIYVSIIRHSWGGGAFNRTENFAQAVDEATRCIITPDHTYLDVLGIKPMLAFFGDVVYFKKVRPSQMVITTYEEKEFLHIAPVSGHPAGGGVEVREYNLDSEEEDEHDGLFF